MPAQFTAFPAYVVYDRTYTATMTMVDSNLRGTAPPATLTNTMNYIIDRDADTYFEMNSVGSSGDGGAINYSVVWDIGKIVWNCQVSAKYSRVQGNNCYLETSTDGTNWTILQQTTATIDASYLSMRLRYVRIRFLNDVAGACQGKFYEVKIMGSD
jgi:hypothetical protein